MSLGKRKADQLEDAAVSKKPLKALPQVKVAYHEGATVKPIIATAPGISLPSNLKFESFMKKASNGTSEVLLHSTTHPTIDFTATENDTHNDQHLKHYVAVFDPTNNQLQVTEAKRLTARSSVRRREAAVSEDEASGDEKPVTNYTSRAALTNTFGTKKSKKAVQSTAENRLLARGDDANNPLSKAILSTMPESDIPEDIDSKLLLQANKPLPVPDLDTEDVDLAYPLTSLIFPNPHPLHSHKCPSPRGPTASPKTNPHTPPRASFLTASPTSQAHTSRTPQMKHTNSTPSSFGTCSSSSRSPGILEHYAHMATSPTVQLAAQNDFRKCPYSLTSGALLHFFPANRLSTPGITLLHTTILALALLIPPPSFQVTPGTLITETFDLQMDLALEPDVCSRYYRELGCKMASPNDAELVLWGMEKVKRRRTEGGARSIQKPRFAKLKLPFDFPSVSIGRRQGRR